MPSLLNRLCLAGRLRPLAVLLAVALPLGAVAAPEPSEPLDALDEGALLGSDDANQERDPVLGAASDEAPAPAEHSDKELDTAPSDTLDAQAGEDELTLEEYERDDWQIVRPRVALLDLGGYLRLRGDLFRRLDFDNGSVWEYNGSEALPRYQTLNDGRAQFNQVSMRLRIEPRLNITEQLQIWSTIDVLDNLAFGQTPYVDAPVPAPNGTPVHALSYGQAPMRRGVNALTDNIVVKRLWARATFLNDQLELRIGRMPDNWGLGMFYNNGDCLNCDWGSVVDRLALSFRALGHIFTPQVDWISRGPMHQAFGYFDPYPTDAVGWDNTMQYALRISREDHPDDIRDRVAHHKVVVNYGLANHVRFQGRDLPQSFYSRPDFSPLLDPTSENLAGYGETRDAVIYQGDAYAKVFAHKLELGAEVALVAGSFKDHLAGSTQSLTTNVLQVGLAAEGSYHFREDRKGLRLDLRFGGASGDGRRGIGALDQADTQRGLTASAIDTRLHNFQFSPDYHVDMILFRRMLGTVTDALYLRPELAYRFDDKLSGRAALIYSQVITGNSAPSATATEPGHKPLGVEVDAEIAYGLRSAQQRGQLLASLAGGMLFPLAGFDNMSAGRPVSQRGGRFAWTLQARMYLTF